VIVSDGGCGLQWQIQKIALAAFNFVRTFNPALLAV